MAVCENSAGNKNTYYPIMIKMLFRPFRYFRLSVDVFEGSVYMKLVSFLCRNYWLYFKFGWHNCSDYNCFHRPFFRRSLSRLRRFTLPEYKHSSNR